MIKEKAMIEPIKFEIRCRVFGCNNRAKHKLGNKEGTPAACYYVCNDCLRGIINTLPDEFKHEESKEVENKETGLEEIIKNMEYKELKQYAKENEINATGKHEELLNRVLNELVIKNG